GGIGAQPRRRDVAAAAAADTEVAVLDAFERPLDAHQLDRAPPARFLLHGVALEGIHARKAAEIRLVEVVAVAFRSRRRVRAEFAAALAEQHPESLDFLRGHLGHHRTAR